MNYRIAPVLLTLGLVPLAQAGTITTFSDLGAFEAAVGATPMTLETFTDSARFPITTGVLNSSTSLWVSNGPAITPGTIQPGVTYSTPVGSDNFFNIDCCNGLRGPFLDTVTGNGPLTVAFDHNTWAFGFNSGYFNNGLGVTINFASGPAYSNTFSVGGDAFYGFMSDAADIQSVVIGGSTNGFTFAIDDFRFTTAAPPIPEPDTYAMLLAGLGLLGFAARRKHRKSA